MTGKKLEIISQIVQWYENGFRIDWSKHVTFKLIVLLFYLMNSET